MDLINDFKQKPNAVLIATSALKIGTDLPEADCAIIITPYWDIHTVRQVIGRIRGGQAILLAFNNTLEQDKMRWILQELKKEV